MAIKPQGTRLCANLKESVRIEKKSSDKNKKESGKKQSNSKRK